MILSIGKFRRSDQFAVSKPTVQRDVKMQNILLTARGVLKLGMLTHWNGVGNK